VAWTCVLTPDAVVDREGPLRLAENALPWLLADSRGDALKTVGAALYRAGRFEEAIGRLNESAAAMGGKWVPKASAFLAMAHHRLGHQDEAQRWLDKLAAYRPKAGSDFSWDDVEIRILRREAESLVLGSRPAAPPSAPPAPIKQATGEPGAKPE
jgi:hypothetical protein